MRYDDDVSCTQYTALPCVWCEDKDHWAGGARVEDVVITEYWEDHCDHCGQISQHNWVIISRV